MAISPSRWREMAIWSETSARRAVNWLEGTLLQAGPRSETAVCAAGGHGYAGILASATLGSRYGASYLLDGIVRQWMVSPGEFHALDEPGELRRRSFLRNSSLLLAACVLGRADVLTEPAIARLQAYQHSSGGFFDMDPGQGHGLVEVFTTAWGGRVALRFGWHERARRAARLVADILHLQPDPGERFYFCYDTISRAVSTRWRPSEPIARFVDFARPAGETHQLGMALAFLAEMHLADPASGWNRPTREVLRLLGLWASAMLQQPAMAVVAEGLALAAWALGPEAEAARLLLPTALEGVREAVEPCGALPAWHSGAGPSYERAFTALESTGWGSVCLAGLAQACSILGS